MNNNSNNNSNIKTNDSLVDRGLKNNDKSQTSRQKVDNAIDSTGSEALQKMGVPKKISDKAIKNNGGRFNPANLPFGKFAKNKSRDALADGLDKMGGENTPPKQSGGASNPNNGGQNFGKRLLNGMSNRAKPQQNPENERRQKQMERAIKVAKHIPIPQVKAAAQAAEKISKSPVGKKLMNKAGGGGNGDSPINTAVTLWKKKKVIMMALPIGLLLLIVVSLISSLAVPAAASEEEMNEGVCLVDAEQNEECDENNEEANDYRKRVKEVQSEYASNGKAFNPIYIAAFYSAVSNNTGDLEYDDMTKEVIQEVADAMFKETTDSEGNKTYTFDKDEFKRNLRNKVLPEYLKDKTQINYDHVISEIFDYITRFESIYGTDYYSNEVASGAAAEGTSLVETARKELDESNPSKYGGAKYWQYMGFNARVEWCACFVSWTANATGLNQSIIPHSAAVDTFYAYYTNAGLFHTINSGYTPKPGDLIIWKRGQNAKGWSHIGIVEKVEGGKLYTIEGNSGDKVSHNVFNSVAASGCTGFATPQYPDNGSTASTIKNGQTILLPGGLGTYATREFDLAVTPAQISYSRGQMSCCRRITNPYAFPENTNQRKVQNMWISQGHKHDSKGFCKLEGRYIIAATSTFGAIGDKVDFYMSGGTIVKVILGDAKSQDKTWYDQHPADKWGHANGQCVLEFMGTDNIGNNPYYALGLHGQTVVKAVNGGTVFK